MRAALRSCGACGCVCVSDFVFPSRRSIVVAVVPAVVSERRFVVRFSHKYSLFAFRIWRKLSLLLPFVIIIVVACSLLLLPLLLPCWHFLVLVALSK